MTIMQNKCTVSLNGAIIISLVSVSTFYLFWTRTRIISIALAFVNHARLILLAHAMCVCVCPIWTLRMKYWIYWAKLIIASLSLSFTLFFSLFLFWLVKSVFHFYSLFHSSVIVFNSIFFSLPEVNRNVTPMQWNEISIRLYILKKGEKKTMKIKIYRGITHTIYKGCNLHFSTQLTILVE